MTSPVDGSCPYDTKRDGDCHLCSRPGWHCNGERPELGVAIPDEHLPLRMYVASKSCHGPKWQEARTAWAEIGVEIISTWIDESGEGESASMADLWVRCVAEASTCDLLVAYHLRGEQWKGAFVEIGAALAHGRYVYVIGRPPGSWVEHPLVTFCENVDDAIEDYRTRPR